MLSAFGRKSENKQRKVWKLIGKCLSLPPQTKEIETMLGIDTPHVPVQGKFAEEIRATMHRVSTGQLNDADKRRVRRSRKVLQNFDAVWE